MKRKYFYSLCIVLCALVSLVGVLVQNDYISLTGIYGGVIHLYDVIEYRALLNVEEPLANLIRRVTPKAILMVLMIIVSLFENVYLFWSCAIIALLLKVVIMYYIERQSD